MDFASAVANDILFCFGKNLYNSLFQLQKINHNYVPNVPEFKTEIDPPVVQILPIAVFA